MRAPLALCALSLVTVIPTAPLAAQSLTSPAEVQAPAAWAASPRSLERLTPDTARQTAWSLDEESVPMPIPASMAVRRRGHGEAVALMVVGAAGIVTGLIADEDILVIAGAGVGGVGLYLYLR